jgi:hypothetical protein
MGINKIITELTKEPFESGSYTNHGVLVQEAERALSEISHTYSASLVGSRLVGAILALSLFYSDSVNFTYSDSRIKQKVDRFIGSEFINKNSFFSKPRDKAEQLVSANEVLFLDDASVNELKAILDSEKYDLVVCFGLHSSSYSREISYEFDYSIHFFKSELNRKILTNVRSSYGSEPITEKIFPTVNGRPSEIVGNLILHIMKLV